MNLFEYEGKQLMGRFDIPVPQSHLLISADAPAPMDLPFVLKAQVMTGGRGKAGGVKVCRTEEEYTRYAQDILHMTIKGHPVHGLLAEQMLQPEQEFYLSITLQGVSTPTLIVSAMGGMDIEQVSREHPEQILKLEIDPFTGLKDYQKRQIAQTLSAADKADVYALLDIFPNAMGVIIVNTTLNVAKIILYESTLGFLGLGMPPPAPEWGQIISDAREYMRVAPHMLLFPALAIVITACSVNLVGDGLRDAMDPHLKS